MQTDFNATSINGNPYNSPGAVPKVIVSQKKIKKRTLSLEIPPSFHMVQQLSTPSPAQDLLQYIHSEIGKKVSPFDSSKISLIGEVIFKKLEEIVN